MDSSPYITANSVAAGFSYDSDGLLTKVGSLNITRDAQTGLIIGTSRNSITSSASYSSFGEVTGLTAAYAGSALFTTQYTRDKLGRITALTETIGGATATYAYGYDSAGRLTDAWKGGTLIGHYEYDSNSNRISYTGQLGSFSIIRENRDVSLINSTDAWKGGTLIGHYEYDSNSNRISYTGQLGSFSIIRENRDVSLINS